MGTNFFIIYQMSVQYSALPVYAQWMTVLCIY